MTNATGERRVRKPKHNLPYFDSAPQNGSVFENVHKIP
jgi:hypothetical protein